MRYSVSGGQSYQDAVRLVQALTGVNIVANITVGGLISILPRHKFNRCTGLSRVPV